MSEWVSVYWRVVERDVCGQVEKAAVPQQTGPQLNADDAEDKEHEEAQQQNVAEHRQRVQQQSN